MRAALDDLAAVAARTGAARRVAVLGDMLELGPASARSTPRSARHASAAGVDLLITVGPLADAIGSGSRASTARRDAGAAAALRRCCHAGDVVLVKGSRGVRLERVCEALETARGGPPA